MSTRQLEALFQPRSIVVVGASEREGSLGGAVLRNLLNSGYEGELFVANRRGYEQVHGVPCFSRVRHLPDNISLAIICTPAITIPRLVRSLGRHGIPAALVVMGGLASQQSRSGRSLTESTLAAARASGIRVLGPNSLGAIVPRLKLNASYAHVMPAEGEVAYIGESAMLGSAMLDWAADRDIGFSHFVTLGDSADVDIDDVIDYLASDWRTRAILLHVERVSHARRFISSLSAAARGKLILVLKSSQLLPHSLHSHPAPPGLWDGDLVYDAVLHRSGALRVRESNELLDALRTLTLARHVHGDRVAIISNGAGPAALARDALLRAGGHLAGFSDNTIERFEEMLPAWGRTLNPVDMSLIASPEQYAQALEILQDDPGVDVVLLIHAPTRRHDPKRIAEAVAAALKDIDLNVLSSWMGGAAVYEARDLLDEAGIPTYATPERAIAALFQMLRWQRNQSFLRQTPSQPPIVNTGQRDTATKIVSKASVGGHPVLTNQDAFALAQAYGIPVAEAAWTDDADEAVALLAESDQPLAIKLRHPALDTPFSASLGAASRWRGVVQDINGEQAMRDAIAALHAWAEQYYPDQQPTGYMLQAMRRGLNSLQLMVGITRDKVFGPLIIIGAGGASVHSHGWRRIGIPPLNMALARDLLRGSEVESKLNEASRNPESRLDALAEILVRLSQLAIDQPRIATLEINPMLLNSSGLLALDVTCALDTPATFAITPYPWSLVETISLHSGRQITIRPIRAEDEPAHQAFHDRLSPEALRFRYFHSRKRFTHRELAQMTQIDYDREMVFIASSGDNDEATTHAEMRAWIDPDNVRAEFSVIVHDEMRGEGLGELLMRRMLAYCRERGTLQVVGTVLPDNKPMLKLAAKLDFKQHMIPEQDVVEISLNLNKPRAEWQRQRLQRPVA